LHVLGYNVGKDTRTLVIVQQLVARQASFPNERLQRGCGKNPLGPR
jgi:hypothetical protein